MDSTKVEIVSKSFDKLVSNLIEQTSDKGSIWNTLTPLLIGAGLTLVAQFSIEFWKSKNDKDRKKQELISKGMAKIYLITQILKDLAMYKTHKQYYLRASKLACDKVEIEDSYNKHYEKGQEQRVTEAKLDEIISEYFQLVTEYLILTNNHGSFQKNFQRIFHYDHPKASKFENSNNEEDLVEELKKEEERLNSEYVKLREIFETIQTAMK